ncbi:hypothetical protein K450DRAFT_259198 [Umbelopsis ramanniana AG]|uniref:Ubinuclein-1 n=1 Tax=Umbelopsis ramanniana AG TaxID=1314678 RepID=A0AAD5E5G2_UMBRA|nr:uncharacterized protein K450DRAFT_259198 [Umbelopsis ramanniana AG]KAI8575965.1 hypothetical protein K450DRAFT_259198 [Umbelopsis ramanniana AG]
MASPEPQADPPKKTKSRTVRIHVDLKEKAPGTIVCYADLLRQALKAKENNTTTHDEPPPNQEAKHPEQQSEDNFFQGLLARSANYTLHDDQDDEDSVGNSNRKKLPENEYDVEDPFIDDSDMLLDDSYAYSERRHDGFFVYQGPLDDEEDKKKATSKKPTSSSANSSSKKSSVKRKAVTDPSDQSHSETEGDGKSTKGVKKSAAKKPATKGSLTTLQAKKRKPESTTDVASKDDSQKKKKPKLDDPTASPSKKSESVKKKATSEAAKEEQKIEGVTSTSNGDVSDKPGSAQNGEKDGRPTSHMASTDTATTSSQQSSATVDEKPKKGANKPVKLTPLDPAVEKIMDRLREDVAKEDFAVKSKFPPTLRPTVLAAGTLVFRQANGPDDNFVNHLMAILPYNKFTLRKFLYKQVGPLRIDELQTEIDGMITVLKQQVDEAMPAQIKQHAEIVAKTKEEDGPKPSEGSDATTDDNAKEDGEQAGSATRFRFNEETRKTLYNIMKAEVARTSLKNELNQLLKTNEQPISETTARKQMYQRLMQCFPDGWMTTYDMSRQYSQYKVRQQKKEDKTASITPH